MPLSLIFAPRKSPSSSVANPFFDSNTLWELLCSAIPVPPHQCRAHIKVVIFVLLCFVLYCNETYIASIVLYICCVEGGRRLILAGSLCVFCNIKLSSLHLDSRMNQNPAFSKSSIRHPSSIRFVAPYGTLGKSKSKRFSRPFSPTPFRSSSSRARGGTAASRRCRHRSRT